MAGVNAALKIKGEEPLVLKRDEAYIGVLLDDLVTKGIDEPTGCLRRVPNIAFTCARITPTSACWTSPPLGLISEDAYRAFESYKAWLKRTEPSREDAPCRVVRFAGEASPPGERLPMEWLLSPSPHPRPLLP